MCISHKFTLNTFIMLLLELAIYRSVAELQMNNIFLDKKSIVTVYGLLDGKESQWYMMDKDGEEIDIYNPTDTNWIIDMHSSSEPKMIKATTLNGKRYVPFGNKRILDFTAYVESHHHIKDVELRIPNNHSNPDQTISALDAMFLLDSDFLSNKKEYHTILSKKHWKKLSSLVGDLRAEAFWIATDVEVRKKIVQSFIQSGHEEWLCVYSDYKYMFS